MKRLDAVLGSPFWLSVFMAALAAPVYVYLANPDPSVIDYSVVAIVFLCGQIATWACLGIAIWPMVRLFRIFMQPKHAHLYPYSFSFCVANGPMALIRAIESTPDPWIEENN